jgi:hypothetical protein
VVRLPDSEIARAIEAARGRMPASPRIRDILVQDYVDSAGDDSLLVRVILTDEAQRRAWKDLRPLNDAIRDSLLDAGEERFAFIHFYSPAEYEEETEAPEDRS